MNENGNDLNRRHFLTRAGAASLLTGLGVQTAAAQAASGKSTKILKVGSVGIGGRGNGAIHSILRADPNTVLWAMGDIDQKAIEQGKTSYKNKFGERAQMSERSFVGFDSFQKVLESGVDVILLTTPPAFRPYQIKMALEAGVHVFAEKPWAVDTPGFQMVKEAVEAGNKKGLSFMTGLVWRYTDVAQQIYNRVTSGELGDVQTAHGYYIGSVPPGPVDLSKRKTIYEHVAHREWWHHRELSGDWILEQYIHSVDKLGWAMKDKAPLRCYGAGGQHQPRPGNNFYDHINITYEYEGGGRAYLNGSHCNRYRTVHDEVFCENGSTYLSGGRCYVKKNGKEIYKDQAPHLGYVAEHKVMMDHIRTGRVFTDIETSANTHLLAMMGRTAAYTGAEVFPEDVLESEEVFFDSSKPWKKNSPFSPGPLLSPFTTKL